MWGAGQRSWEIRTPQPDSGKVVGGGGGGSGMWSLDPNHYAQIPHQQVDWASLAQQWIQMQGTASAVLQNQQPTQRPDTTLQNLPEASQYHCHDDAHQEDVIGEAPMDLDDQTTGQNSVPLYTRSSSTNMPSLLLINQGNNGLNSSQFIPELQGTSTSAQPPPWVSPPAVQQHQYSFQGSSAITESEAHSQSKHNVSHYNDWSHKQESMDLLNFAQRGKYHMTKHLERKRSYAVTEELDAFELDAARRKTLPSWIREGLEKVEREKRKIEEKERLDAAREEERRLRRIRDYQLSEVITEGNDENEDASTPLLLATPTIGNLREQTNIEHRTFPIKLKATLRPEPTPSPPQLTLTEILASLSKDEQMEQAMLSVRRQLTNILMEVTSEEMRLVALEALDRARAKEKVTSSRGQCQALTSLTAGPLGLGDYGTDSEDSQSETEEEPVIERDSEAELITEIERKKRNFEMKNLVEDEDENENGVPTPGNQQGAFPRGRSKSNDTPTNGHLKPSSGIAVPEEVSAKSTEKSKSDEKRSHSRSQNERRASRRHRTSSSSGSSSTTDRRRRSRRSRSRSRSHSRDRNRRRSRSRRRGGHRVHRRDRSRSRSASSRRWKQRSRSSSRSRKDQRHRRSISRHSRKSSTISNSSSSRKAEPSRGRRRQRSRSSSS